VIVGDAAPARNPAACRRTLKQRCIQRGNPIPDAPPIFTIGYEKRSIDDLIWVLRAQGVARVVDVRLTPASRRPDFSKKRLSSALEAAGIAYEHRGALGNPPAIRELYLVGDAGLGHERFREHLENGASAALHDLAESLAHETVALLCLERDPYRCHRWVVASVVAESLSGERAVIHL
jgi:Uncharacterized conserved protein